MSTVTVGTPAWLDWSVVLRSIRLVQVPGETVDAAAGTWSWSYPGRSPQLIEVGPSEPDPNPGPELTVRTDGDRRVAVAEVSRRLHLDLSPTQLADALGRAEYAELEAGASPVRLPAATSPWAFCLCYLSGGSADHEVTQRLFALAGQAGLPPRPAELARVSASDLAATGLKASRVPVVHQLAEQFAADPDLADPVQFGRLTSADAVGWVAELPHLGKARAPQLAAQAWGHDDIGYDPWSLLGAGSRTPAQLRELAAAGERAAPLRSVLSDTICAQLLEE